MEVFFPSLNVLFQPNKRNRFDERGNYTYPKSGKTLSSKPLKTKKINFGHPYLKKIETLCKANNIQLIYYFAPMRTERIEYINPKFPVIDNTKVFSDDFFFYDDIHVNNLGREKVSILFADEYLNIINKELD